MCVVGGSSLHIFLIRSKEKIGCFHPLHALVASFCLFIATCITIWNFWICGPGARDYCRADFDMPGHNRDADIHPMTPSFWWIVHMGYCCLALEYVAPTCPSLLLNHDQNRIHPTKLANLTSTLAGTSSTVHSQAMRFAPGSKLKMKLESHRFPRAMTAIQMGPPGILK